VLLEVTTAQTKVYATKHLNPLKNMLKKLYVLLCMLCLASFQPLMTQTNKEVNLTQEEIDEFREKAVTVIKEFMDYVVVLAAKDKKADTKQFFKTETLKLFVHNGEKIKGEQAMMQVSEVKNGKESVKTITIKQYVEALIKLKYSQAEIKFAETFYVSNFYKVGENKYTATATIFQKFTGYNADGTAKYTDITKKTIEIEVELVEDMYGKRWDVKLKDVEVVETIK
jgi:hypothetical protein